MALLTPSHNSEATNHPFPQKITDVYTSEGLKLNVIKKTVLNISEIVDNDDLQDLPELANDLTRWTANIIEKRTQKFAAMALEIWDLTE